MSDPCDTCKERQELLDAALLNYKNVAESLIRNQELTMAHSDLLHAWMERAGKYARLLEEHGIAVSA